MLYDDHPAFAQKCLSIRDKSGLVVPCKLSVAGLKLCAAVNECRERGDPARIIFPKARQIWISTAVASLFFKEIAFTPGQRCDIVADVAKNASNIYGYYQQFIDSYRPPPGEVFAPEMPEVLKRNQGEIDWANGSQLKVQTARNVQSGRSYSSRYGHLSEFAYYQDAGKLMTGFMQTVPDDPGTIVVVESTANGVGGEFYRMWQRAIDPGVSSDWVGVFVGWPEHAEYVKPLRIEPYRFQDSLSRYELEIRQRHGLTLEQLNWRRWCLENNCRGSLDRFNQEYPITPDVAFIAGNRTYYDMAAVERMPIDLGGVQGELERVRMGIESRIQFREVRHGALTVWRRPEKGRFYIAGVDTAQGIDVDGDGAGSRDPDYSVCNVIDQHTGEQVANLRGRIGPAAFAEYLYSLCEWYEWAYMVPEANNTGLAFITELVRLGYPLEHIYSRRGQADLIRKPLINEIGWLTTSATKPVLVSALDTAIRDGSILVRAPWSIQELRTFVIKPDGKTEGQEGCHDDEVISLALCAIGLRFAPQRRQRDVAAAGRTPFGATYGQSRDESRGVRVRI